MFVHQDNDPRADGSWENNERAVQYVARLVIFGLIGFSLADNLPLIVLLTIGSIIGTEIGKRVLLNINPDKARYVFKVVVTAIAMGMIFRVGNQR